MNGLIPNRTDMILRSVEKTKQTNKQTKQNMVHWKINTMGMVVETGHISPHLHHRSY